MITLQIINIVLFIITFYRIYKKCNYNFKEFSPFKGNVVEFWIFLFTGIFTLIIIIFYIIIYLP